MQFKIHAIYIKSIPHNRKIIFAYPGGYTGFFNLKNYSASGKNLSLYILTLRIRRFIQEINQRNLKILYPIIACLIFRRCEFSCFRVIFYGNIANFPVLILHKLQGKAVSFYREFTDLRSLSSHPAQG